MKPLRLFTSLAAAAAALSLAGCGSKPFCDRQKETFDSVLETMDQCPSAKEMMDANRPDDGKCAASYEDCSGSDKQILDESVACLAALPTCTRDTEATTWAQKAFLCQTKTLSLSAACARIMKPPFCKAQKASLDLTLKKVANCETMKAGMEAGMPPAGRCEQVLPSCDEADQAVLDEMVLCLNALPVCTPETETDTWGPAAIECQAKINSLTEACKPIAEP